MPGAMVDTFAVPPKTVVTASGESPAVDIGSAAGPRVFLLTVLITEVIEQESLDVSIWGSADGADWGQKPLLKFPQKFYRGEHPLLLDLSSQPQVKFLRARWEVARWGRGDTTPRFEWGLQVKEVPAEILKETAMAQG
jgi:hypothetical protein